MDVTRVTVDLGNSRLKLRAWAPVDGAVPGDPQRFLAVELDGDADSLAERVRAWIEAVRANGENRGRVVHASLASVASEERERVLRDALASSCDALWAEPNHGLEIHCRLPERVGLDRLWAARGALALTGRSCIVVDAGTALTVDAVKIGATGEEPGVFLGGAIAPGPALLARALSEGAARLPRVDVKPGVPALGLDTEGAIRSGVVHGLRGAARELARRIAEEAALDSPALVITGGARSFLLHPESVFEGFGPAPLVSEDLVHIGLIAAGFAGPA